jgi:hypothetical protein
LCFGNRKRKKIAKYMYKELNKYTKTLKKKKKPQKQKPNEQRRKTPLN